MTSRPQRSPLPLPWARLATWAAMAAVVFMTVWMSAPASAQTTETAIKHATTSLDVGVPVWIAPDAYGADMGAITKAINTYPELDLKVIVLGPELEGADVKHVSTHLMRTYGGTVLTFTPSTMYMASNKVSQARINGTISELSSVMATETNVAKAVDAVGKSLRDEDEGSLWTTFAWAFGIVAILGVAWYWYRARQRSRAELEEVEAIGEAMDRPEDIAAVAREAKALRDSIAALIMDINDTIVMSPDPTAQQDFSRYVVEYERYSSSVETVTSVAMGRTLVGNLERVQAGLQRVSGTLL